MAKPYLKGIDPLQIYLHAVGFHTAADAVGRLTLGPNTQIAGQVVRPNMVLSALTSELFLKCMVCIETTNIPKGHHLFELFNLLTAETRNKIILIWDTYVVPAREPMWRMMEQHQTLLGKKIDRDLPGALLSSSRAFEAIRYSYEPESKEADFYISDLPNVLRRVVLHMKPEWENLGLDIQPVPGFGPG